jgi:hypothetical protein
MPHLMADNLLGTILDLGEDFVALGIIKVRLSTGKWCAASATLFRAALSEGSDAQREIVPANRVNARSRAAVLEAERLKSRAMPAGCMFESRINNAVRGAARPHRSRKVTVSALSLDTSILEPFAHSLKGFIILPFDFANVPTDYPSSG